MITCTIITCNISMLQIYLQSEHEHIKELINNSNY